MNFKFYPLKALSLFLLFWAIGTGVHAQSMDLAKSVKNYTTGGDGSTASQGDELIYTITVTNTSSKSSFTNSKLYDNIPSGVSYISGSTSLNGSSVSDVSGKMPFANGGLINTSGKNPGILGAGRTATIVFHVKVTANAGSIRNYATVDATQGGQSYVNQTNTVFTNLIRDALCSTIFSTTPFSTGGSTYQYIRDVDASTGQSNTIFYDGSTGPCYDAITGDPYTTKPLLSSSAAIGYDKSSNRIYFVNNNGFAKQPLSYIDLSGSTIAAYYYPGYYLETTLGSNWNINRMCFASDGMGYALTSKAQDLIQFYIDPSTHLPVITRLGGLTNDVNNPWDVQADEDGGDIFGDGSGKLYLIGNSSRIYKIDPSTRVATYMGTATPSPGTSQAIAIDGNGTVYIGGAYNPTMVYSIDLFTMGITPINSSSTNVFNSGDFTSCSFPVLSSNIVANKTYKNKNGSSTVVGGDTVTYIITISNIGNFNAAGVKLYDYIPASTHYLGGSTTLNGSGISDNGGTMPFAISGGALVSSPGESPGIIKTGPSNAAVVTFDVVTDPNVTVCNQSKITLLDADGNIIFVNSSDGSGGNAPTCFYSDDVLPLTDLKFKGSLKNNQSILDWSMTSDDNLRTYEVQYSEDGVVFKTIGTVAPKGATNMVNQYEYIDQANIYSSIRYYRLKMTQKGGSITYSGIVRLNVKALDMQVMPNPFDKNLNLQFQLKASEKVKVRILDFYGREIYTSTDQYSAGSHSISISLPSTIAKGMYVLDVIAGSDHIFQKKLVRQ